MKTRIFLFCVLSLAVFSSCKKDEKKDDNTVILEGYPANGLISYFNFDDNLKDQMGNCSDGTNHGATFIAGKGGKALNCDGSGQYVTFAKDEFVSGNTISVSCWIKVGAANQTMYFLMCSDFGLFSTDYIGMAISVPETNNAKGAYTRDTWHHLVGTFDGTNIKSYVDGVLTQTTEHPGDLQNLDYNLHIGTFDTTTGFWVGSIDDLFIYDRVLTQSEITQLYNYHK